MSRSPINVAVLGTGQMGHHAIGYLHNDPHVQDVIGYDVDSSRLKKTKETFDIHTTDSLESILNDPTISLVFITSPNHTHKGLTIKAMEAGKAVMCEKPIAATYADSVAVIEAAECTGGFLQIGLELRYSLLYTTIKDWIDQGLIGQVRNTSCEYILSEFWRKHSWRCQQNCSGSMFAEKICHYVDHAREAEGTPHEILYEAL